MWIYSQSRGDLWHDQDLVGTGYAGSGNGKNNPAMQFQQNVGPLPVGMYSIRPAVRHPRLGIVAMPLEPAPGTILFGRSGFYIHGDSQSHPGEASTGCIVLDYALRLTIAVSSDRTLKVIP